MPNKIPHFPNTYPAKALGGTFLWLGDLPSSREHAEQGIVLYNLQQHRTHAFLYGQDPGVSCLFFAAEALWRLGYPDQALKRSHEALTLARELSHPYSLAEALCGAASVHQYRREGRLTQQQAEAAMTLATEQGFLFWFAMGMVFRGWALTEQGQGTEGIAQMRQGLTTWRSMGAEQMQSQFLALFTEAYGKVGQTEEGLYVLAEALAFVDRTGERYYEAELYRLKGELLLAQAGSRLQAIGQREKRVEDKSEVTNLQPPTPDTLYSILNTQHFTLNTQAEAEAEACFLKAIEIARRQEAKSLELRAVMSLARLWQQQGKKDEARQKLVEIYHWFTEGFDTTDLQEAERLLETLA